MIRYRWLPWAALAAALGGSGCQQTSTAPATAPAKPAAPAKVSSAKKEADLATVQLTPEAEKRLGVALAAVERKPVARVTSYGGDVMVPPGRLITVASPFLGTLKNPDGGEGPTPGGSVKEGQPMFVLVPILTAEAQAQMAPLLIEAEGQIKQAQEQLKARQTELERAERLYRDKLGGSALVVDAKAAFNIAQAALRAAEQRREVLTKVIGDAAAGKINVQTIEAPASGVIQNVHVRAGQKVAAGALMFDVVSLDPIWIKVPVYVGELSRLATDKDATVGGLADVPGASTKVAKPVPAPPSGDPLSATVNVFYEVANPDNSLKPGQRVGVTLPLRGDEESLVVPRAALLRDLHGGAWVYENTAPHTYARRRVVVDRVVGDLAALASGPKPGAKVVTDGAAELFGTEFGGGK